VKNLIINLESTPIVKKLLYKKIYLNKVKIIYELSKFYSDSRYEVLIENLHEVFKLVNKKLSIADEDHWKRKNLLAYKN
jgi:hypothetical protein